MTRKLLSVLAGVLLIAALAGCNNTPTVVQNDNNMSNAANKTLLNNAMQATGYRPLTASEEMHNLLERILRQNDPNHISYLYLFLPGVAQPLGYYVIKGKCSSTDSLPVNPTQPLYDGNGNATAIIDAAQLDGSFGTNEQGIFCFLDNAARTMITWSGVYFQSDSYIPLAHVPVLH